MDVTAEAGDTQITLTHPVNNDWVQGQISLKNLQRSLVININFRCSLPPGVWFADDDT